MEMIFDRGRLVVLFLHVSCILLLIVGLVGSDTASSASDLGMHSGDYEGPPYTTKPTTPGISDSQPHAPSETTTLSQVDPDSTRLPDYVGQCPSNLECSKLGGECIDCDLSSKTNCTYGSNISVTCRPKPHIHCTGPETFTRWLVCQYCYQTPRWQQRCTANTQCKVVSSPRERYLANCTVNSEVLCLGRRAFDRHELCNWTSGKRWSTAMILSVTVGGFGADRFYLGLWKEGVGKLFSFGGLGVWTLVDVILVATGYVGPADGSLYIS